MELSTDLAFSMLPREVMAANARRWHRAVSVSLAVHALVLGAVPQQHLPALQQVSLPPLSVLLQSAVPETATSVVAAESRQQRPVATHRDNPAPTPTETRDVLRASPDAQSASAPLAAVPAREPVAATVPVAAVAAPRPARPVEDPALLAGYNRALAAAVDRHKHYPRIALIRQWQGTVVLQLDIGADGRVRDYRLARSSRYDALDQEALEMLRAAMPLPPMPAQLAGIDVSVDIPVTFRITD
jgi:periplasmic protein TonB